MKLLAYLFAVFLLTACVGVDNREQIAMTTLYPDKAPATNPKTAPIHAAPILTAALNGKFPPGSELEAFKSYVTKLNGGCQQPADDRVLRCSLTETGSFCIKTIINLTAKINSSNTIEGIEAVRFVDGC